MEKMIIINEVNKLAEESHLDVRADENVAEILASTYHELREGRPEAGLFQPFPCFVIFFP